jgi:hypothetical protein
MECRAPSLKSRQYNTGRFPAPAIWTRAAWRTLHRGPHQDGDPPRGRRRPEAETVAYLLTWFWASFHFYNIYPLETSIFRSDTVATAGRVFRARTRLSFMRAIGAGRSSPTVRFSPCSPGFTYGSACSNAISRPRPILARRCGRRTTTTIRRCTSSPRPRARQSRRPSGWSTTTLTPHIRRRRR